MEQSLANNLMTFAGVILAIFILFVAVGQGNSKP
jgi:hypothetical protein